MVECTLFAREGFFGPFGAMQIIPSAQWPQVPSGMRTVRSKGHPLVYALARLLARLGIALEPDVVWEVPAHKDQDPIVMGNRIFCSLVQMATIRRMLATPTPDLPA